MTRAAAIALLALVVGCGGSSQERGSSDARVIRGWSAALNAGSYESAASYFARGAIVEQTRAIRLRDRNAALAFNLSLPCRADLTATKDEGQTTLGTFRLRRGPGGACHGSVRVRFTIRGGKFTEWRQLPNPRPPGGESA
jgi:hypothetical protein